MRGDIIKRIFGTIIGFYLIVFIFASPIYSFIFPWGGVGETYLYPIYFGLIVLSAIIVICTCIIIEEIRELQQKINQEIMKIHDNNEEEKK